MDLVNREREKMILLFGDNSEWRKKNIENKSAIITADQLIEKQLVSVAYYHQDKGDKNKDKKEYVKAAELYYGFLKSRPSDIMVVGARFNYAQVLFNLGDYKGSANEYKAVREYTGDMGYKEKSGFGLVSSLQNWIKARDPKYTSKEIKPLLSEKGELLPSKKLSKLEEDLIDACDKYIEINPTGKRAVYVMYVKAEVLFRNNRLVDARATYEKIIDASPNDKVAIDSMKNLIATYNYEKNYDEVKKWGSRLLATKSFEDKRDIKEIKGLVTGSLFRSAKKMEDEGKLTSAAEEYIRLAKQYSKSEYSDAALYNAGVIYEKTGDSQLAIRSYRTMLTKYPKSKHAASAMFRVAVNYEQRLDFDGALYFYEEITKKYPSSEFAVDCEYNAYRLRRGRNDYARAAEHLMRYQAKTKDSKERSKGVLTSAWLYEKSGNDKKALDTYQIYITKNPKDLDGVMKAMIASGNILSSNSKYTQAAAEYEKAIHSFKTSGSPKNGSAADYNAEARFKILGELNSKYRSIKINKTNSGKTIKENYDKKEALLQKLADEYLKVVELGSAQWSVASLYMIGAAFQGFANFLYDAPVPVELNNEELVSEYKRQIEQQAMPFEDKAIEYYEKSINESARLKLVNDWTRLAKNKMSELKPDQYYYGKMEEFVSSPAIEIKDYGFVGI
jgi:tetratricopeptide (TPR) repeat protein